MDKGFKCIITDGNYIVLESKHKIIKIITVHTYANVIISNKTKKSNSKSYTWIYSSDATNIPNKYRDLVNKYVILNSLLV